MNDTIKLFDGYGDKISLGLIPESFDPETTSEEDQRKLARQFAEKICVPGKSSFISVYAVLGGIMTPAFREELYKQSRILYSN